MKTYIRRFGAREDAFQWMRSLNHATLDGSIYCMTDGPEDDYAVVDLRTAIDLAIDLGLPYEWAR